MSRRPSPRAARRPTAGSADLFAALGNETRLRLVRRLSTGGPSSIVHLAAGSAVTRQAVTKHLEVLARAGLVRGARRGREHLWQLEPDRIEEAQRWLEAISARWDRALERLRAAVEEPQEAPADPDQPATLTDRLPGDRQVVSAAPMDRSRSRHRRRRPSARR